MCTSLYGVHTSDREAEMCSCEKFQRDLRLPCQFRRKSTKTRTLRDVDCRTWINADSIISFHLSRWNDNGRKENASFKGACCCAPVDSFLRLLMRADPSRSFLVFSFQIIPHKMVSWFFSLLCFLSAAHCSCNILWAICLSSWLVRRQFLAECPFKIVHFYEFLFSREEILFGA